MESTLSAQSEENKSIVEDLHKQLQQQKSDLQVLENQCTKLQASVSDQTEKLTAANEKIGGLESALASKVCLFVMYVLE